jgi:uncharacterized protein with HEPN domain
MKKIDSDFIRLRDILNAIADIENFYVSSGLDDRKTLMAIAYSIAIIGEAASKISEKVKVENPEIPWRNIVGVRHRIIHEYGSVDVENLKQVVESDLVVLKKKIELILSKF